MFFISCFLIGVSVFVVIVGAAGIYYCLSSHFFLNPPPVPSNRNIRKAVLKEIETMLSQSSGKTIMDLGSGWGSFLIPLARKFPHHTFIGIEKAFLPYFYAKIKSKHLKNLCFKREDLFTSDISNADIILLYLIGHLMPLITKKCLSEMKTGAYIYSNHFPLTNVKPLYTRICGNSFDRYYIYQITN